MSEKRLGLDDIALIGRTFAEYHRLFALDNINADDVILDAAAGVSSFCAEANALGYRVTAADPIYPYNADTIESKCAVDLARVMAMLPPVADMYVWDYFPDIPTLASRLEQAYRTFLVDFREHGHVRYMPTTLPQTRFADDQFTLALVSHLLFLYDDQLDYTFHKATLQELLRVTSREIRVFPLVNLRFIRSSFVAQVIDDPEFADHSFEIVPVDYELLKGGNEMLLITKAQ